MKADIQGLTYSTYLAYLLHYTVCNTK